MRRSSFRNFLFWILILSIFFTFHDLNTQGVENPSTLAPVWSYTKEDSEATFWKLDWSPDGELVAATFFDNKLLVLDSSDGSLVNEINMDDFATRCDGFAPEGTKPLRTCSFSPDGTMLATGGDDLMVRIFEVGSWDLVRTFTGHSGSILCLDWSPDSKYLASGSGMDKVIPQNAGENVTRIWDVETGDQVGVLEGHEDGVLAVRWNDEGSILVTASDDRTAKVWSFPECRQILEIKGHTSGLLDVCWTPDETRILTGSRDYKIKVWNSTTGEELMTWSDYNCVRSVDVHPDGELAATSGVDLTLKIRDMETGTELKVIRDGVEQKAMVMHSRWSPDGNRIFSGLGKSHTVIMYSFGEADPSDPGPLDSTYLIVGSFLVVGALGTALIFYPAIRELRRRRD